MKKIIGLLVKWTLKSVLYGLLAILILVNGFILLSGRTYLYRGIWLTYLSGEAGPTIYDLDKFHTRKIAKGRQETTWIPAQKYSTDTAVPNFEEYNQQAQSTAFLIFENDSIVFEKYWSQHNDSTISNSFSAAKTVIGMLIGIAVEEGAIKQLDESVGSYIPEFQKDDLQDVTIRHLLLMASGLNWSESGKNPLSNNAESYYGSDLYGLVTRQQRIEQPGKTFIYQSGNSQLLGFILQKATGQTVSDYCSEKLWSKMDMESDAYWSLDKENGDEKAFCCLYATARDFGRIGKLICDRGRWNGKQLVPEWYFAQMIESHTDLNTEQGYENYQYGLHIWLYQNYSSPVYYCRGILGQYIIAIPDKKRIIVRLGHKRTPDIPFADAKNDKKAVGHPADVIDYINFADEIVRLKN